MTHIIFGKLSLKSAISKTFRFRRQQSDRLPRLTKATAEQTFLYITARIRLTLKSLATACRRTMKIRRLTALGAQNYWSSPAIRLRGASTNPRSNRHQSDNRRLDKLLKILSPWRKYQKKIAHRVIITRRRSGSGAYSAAIKECEWNFESACPLFFCSARRRLDKAELGNRFNHRKIHRNKIEKMLTPLCLRLAQALQNFLRDGFRRLSENVLYSSIQAKRRQTGQWKKSATVNIETFCQAKFIRRVGPFLRADCQPDCPRRRKISGRSSEIRSHRGWLEVN